MLKYGYPWPEMLRCDKFPLDNDLCLGPQTGSRNEPGEGMRERERERERERKEENDSEIKSEGEGEER